MLDPQPPWMPVHNQSLHQQLQGDWSLQEAPVTGDLVTGQIYH